MQCTKGRIIVFPCNTALYDVQGLTCEAELFFQSTGNFSPCKRRPLYHYNTSLLQRHEKISIYHFPNHLQVTIRCPNGKGWKLYNEVLFEAGNILNATVFHHVQRGSNTARTPRKDLHDAGHKFPASSGGSTALVGHEVPQLLEAFPTEAGEIDNLKAQLQTPQRSNDLDTLLEVR